MSKPGKWNYIGRVVLAIPMFLITILFIVAGFKLHKNLFIGLGILFAFVSLYCLHSFITALCCGLMGMHLKHKCCRSCYVFCCMCFIKDMECCTGQEDNRCPCFKWCCVDDIETPPLDDYRPPGAELQPVFTVADDQHPADAEAAASLLHGSKTNPNPNQPPPIYKGGAAPKYEGW